MADTEKVAKIKALLEEVRELSEELSEEELKQVAGGGVPGPIRQIMLTGEKGAVGEVGATGAVGPVGEVGPLGPR
ncbi:MAG: bacteriocin [Coriobacteriales bacterium]|jgi:bacteriocin-like protein|nr:bacteriocin [Coriobacteriales bacterium]